MYLALSETKNVNSLRSVERAVRGEMIRHAELLNKGERVVQETRHFQEDTGLTRSGRSKEQAEDYRYFPEPDLVPIVPDATWIETMRAALPEKPSIHRKRLQEAWAVPDKEMASMINADVLEIVEATVILGADPTKSAWLVARRNCPNRKRKRSCSYRSSNHTKRCCRDCGASCYWRFDGQASSPSY